MKKDRKMELFEQYENGDKSLYEEVLSLYEDALKENPDDPNTLFFYGVLQEYRATDLMRNAVICYEKGIELTSKKEDEEMTLFSRKFNGQLIHIRSSLHENNKSVEFYKKYVSAFPDDPQGYCYLAHSYFLADQINEAKKVVEAGLKISSNYAILHYWYGEILSRLGMTDSAIEEWDMTLALDPTIIDARFSKASLLEHGKKYAKAAQEFRIIIEYLKQNNFNPKWCEDELERINKLM